VNNSQILEAYKGGAAWRDLFDLLDLARIDERNKLIKHLQSFADVRKTVDRYDAKEQTDFINNLIESLKEME